MKIMLAQINCTIGDFKGNLELIVGSIAKAKTLGARIVVFPELAICGYPPGDLLLLPHFIDMAAETLELLIACCEGIAVIVGLPRCNEIGGEKHLFNSAAIIDDGVLIGYQDKSLLPTYDVFDERRYFEPAHQCKPWSIAGKHVAITICEDIWQHSNQLTDTTYAKDPIADFTEASLDFLINLSASPYSVSKCQKRVQTCQAVAKTLHVPVLLCNQVGGNDGLLFDGHSCVVGSDGQLVAIAKGFAEDLLLRNVSAQELSQSSSLSNVSVDDQDTELYKALVMGVADYFRKSSFKTACIALSGGVDSALVACIAADALGSANVSCIAMPSRFSSEGSVTDACKLAENLKVDFKVVPIEAPFESFLDLTKPYFHGSPFGVTEENLQARIRGVIVMAFSNKFGSIVLSTGNKSELAVGYSTLYGDMCGGLAVIGDLTKRQVYALCRYINRTEEVIPEAILTKAPSAELRPNQKDSDSLPDYAILDTIVQAYIEKHLSPSQIAATFGFPQDLVDDIVVRIHRNEYKRRQSPPVLRVSEKAFSVGRDFPIVQNFV